MHQALVIPFVGHTTYPPFSSIVAESFRKRQPSHTEHILTASKIERDG